MLKEAIAAMHGVGAYSSPLPPVAISSGKHDPPKIQDDMSELFPSEQNFEQGMDDDDTLEAWNASGQIE